MSNTERYWQLYPHPHTVSAFLPHSHIKVQDKQYQLILQSQLAIKHKSSKWLPYQESKIPALSVFLNLTIKWLQTTDVVEYNNSLIHCET